MKKIFTAAILLLTLCSLCSAAENAINIPLQDTSNMIQEFSATFVEKFFDEVQTGKLYVTKDRTRYEISGKDEIMVTRADQKVLWLIFPKFRAYVEQPYDIPQSESFGRPEEFKTGNLSREFIDYEWEDSYRLRKFLVTVKYGVDQQDQYYEWYRDNFPLPLRTQSLDGQVSYEYKEIKLKTPDPALFAKPPRYKKVTLEEIMEMEEKSRK